MDKCEFKPKCKSEYNKTLGSAYKKVKSNLNNGFKSYNEDSHRELYYSLNEREEKYDFTPKSNPTKYNNWRRG